MIEIKNVASRGIVRGYERDGLFGIQEVFEHIGREKVCWNGRWVAMDIPRYRVFEKSSKCVTCGVEGTFFALERGAMRRKGLEDVWVPNHRDVWHFNLYGFRPNGTIVMLTKDHIIPTSRGGSDEVENLQPMCQPCNERKGNRLPDEMPQKPQHQPRTRAPKTKTVSPFTRFEIMDRGQMIAHIVREEEALKTFRNLRRNGRPAAELIRIDMVPVRTKVNVPEDEPASLFYSDSELNTLRAQLREGHALAKSVAETRGYELDPRIAEAITEPV